MWFQADQVRDFMHSSAFATFIINPTFCSQFGLFTFKFIHVAAVRVLQTKHLNAEKNTLMDFLVPLSLIGSDTEIALLAINYDFQVNVNLKRNQATWFFTLCLWVNHLENNESWTWTKKQPEYKNKLLKTGKLLTNNDFLLNERKIGENDRLIQMTGRVIFYIFTFILSFRKLNSDSLFVYRKPGDKSSICLFVYGETFQSSTYP